MNTYIQETTSAVPMSDVLAMLSHLSRANKKWLANRLFEEVENAEEEDCDSRETIIRDLKQAREELRLYDEGKIQFKSAEDLLHEIQNN